MAKAAIELIKTPKTTVINVIKTEFSKNLAAGTLVKTCA